jgi:hypothetical protein
MDRADQIIAYGRLHAAELRREAERARVTQGLAPRPCWPALIAQLRALSHHLRSVPRAPRPTLRPGIASPPIRKEAGVI